MNNQYKAYILSQNGKEKGRKKGVKNGETYAMSRVRIVLEKYWSGEHNLNFQNDFNRMTPFERVIVAKQMLSEYEFGSKYIKPT